MYGYLELVGMSGQHMFGMPYDPNTRLLKELLEAMTEQTNAINALAESNQAIVNAMLQSEGVEPESNPYQTLD
jgi:hypothetical protein